MAAAEETGVVAAIVAVLSELDVWLPSEDNISYFEEVLPPPFPMLSPWALYPVDSRYIERI